MRKHEVKTMGACRAYYRLRAADAVGPKPKFSDIAREYRDVKENDPHNELLERAQR